MTAALPSCLPGPRSCWTTGKILQQVYEAVIGNKRGQERWVLIHAACQRRWECNLRGMEDGQEFRGYVHESHVGCV